MKEQKQVLEISSTEVSLYKNSFKYISYKTKAEDITIEIENSDLVTVTHNHENKVIKIVALSELGSIEFNIKAQVEDSESIIKIKVNIIEWEEPFNYQTHPLKDLIKKKYDSEIWFKKMSVLIEENAELYNSALPFEIVTFFSFRYKDDILTRIYIGEKMGKFYRETINEYDDIIKEDLFIPILYSQLKESDKFIYAGQKCDIISVDSMYKRDWDYIFITQENS